MKIEKSFQFATGINRVSNTPLFRINGIFEIYNDFQHNVNDDLKLSIKRLCNIKEDIKIKGNIRDLILGNISYIKINNIKIVSSLIISEEEIIKLIEKGNDSLIRKFISDLFTQICSNIGECK